MASPLDVECLLAAIGVGKVIGGKATLHRYQLEQAAGTVAKIRKTMMRFLATDATEPAEDYPEYDYAELKKLLAHGPTPEQMASLQGAVPDPELAQELGVMASKIQAWGNTVFPRETRQTIRGPVDDEPAPSTWADFCRIWQVAIDPMSVMRDLAEGCLSDDQVAVCATLWPSLYAEMRSASVDGLMSVKRELTLRKEAQLQTLRQEPAFDAELAGVIQGIYAQSSQSQATPKPSIQSDAEQAKNMTPGERAASGS